MRSGFAVQVKGFGSLFVSVTKRSWRPGVDDERNTPRFNRGQEYLAKKPSTALSQEHEAGVK